jgi:acetyltransferase-like isoleucine patch superfamily enzyme
MNIKYRHLIRSIINYFPVSLQIRINSFISSRGRLKIGKKVFLHKSVQILGKDFVQIGNNSVLSQDCWLNVNHRIGNYNAIDIGDHCFIGRRNFFSSGKQIVIGHYVLTANDCNFLGSSHIVDDPMKPYITTGTTENRTIMVGHNTFFGSRVSVIGNVKIGHGCVIGANSVITSDIPPFSQVAGFPATIRRRYSFLRKAWVLTTDFTSDDEKAIPSLDDYLKHLKMHTVPRMPYIAAGSDLGQI